MKKNILLFVVGIVLVSNISAVEYYIDNTATGSNSGTSWSNAWQSLGNINWGSIQPGDVIYISGGTTSKTYSETLVIGASGSSNSNRIYIRTGAKAPSPSGHDGMVIIDGGTNGISSSSRSYVTVDGEKSGTQNLRIISTTSNAIHSPGTSYGMKFFYLHVDHTGTGDDNSFAFRIMNTDSDTEIAYNDIDTPYANAVRFGGR